MDLLQNNQHEAIRKHDVERTFSIILLIYVFALPFTSAFSLSFTFTLPFCVSFILFLGMLFSIIRQRKIPVNIIGFDIFLVVFLMLIVLISFLYNGLSNKNSLLHTFDYFYTFAVFYTTIKYYLFKNINPKKTFYSVLKYLSITTLFTAFFTNIEFIAANFLHLNLNDYIYRGAKAESEYDAMVLNLFYRARGFSYESGALAFMMELFGPLTIYYIYFSGLCDWNKYIKLFCLVSLISSILFTTSVASFLIIPAAFLFSIFMFYKKVLSFILSRKVKFLLVCLVLGIVLFIVEYYYKLWLLISLNVTDKASSESYYDRAQRIKFFFNQFSRFDLINKLIGIGPAGYNNLGYNENNSILCLYYSITFELGYIGILFFLSFLLFFTFKILSIKSSFGFFLLASFVSGLLHYYFIANYFFPWFWFILTFALFYKKYYSEINEKNHPHSSNL